MGDPLAVVIAGEPVAQGRPRFSRFGGPGQAPLEHPRAIEPAKSRSWKSVARRELRAALEYSKLLRFPTEPLEVEVIAVFSCPKTDHRKRTPALRRPHAKRPDAENVAKAVLDAATGIVWGDDAQVARLLVVKEIAAQGEAPFVELRVRALVVRQDSAAAIAHGLFA